MARRRALLDPGQMEVLPYRGTTQTCGATDSGSGGDGDSSPNATVACDYRRIAVSGYIFRA